ncbi:class I lanthipeptide [uncultured Dokdonia sp.]|uniref:class I lanthipeptide n=1 Tax=uncultured Dokdonia sp. TaxID=575653 RepID=UPI00262A2C68|nr:class I lanthipeptide [uncultured Dokdonia sp.]
MRKINQNSPVAFQKVTIARLNSNDLNLIRGGQDQETSEDQETTCDSISFTVIRSSLKCLGLSLTTVSG